MRSSTTTRRDGRARENERDAYGRPISEARIKAAEIYRTDDKGKTWQKVSVSNEFMTGHSGTYGWVFGQIRVDPTDENTIYSLGLGLNVSRDAGKSFTELRGMHGDHHGLWIDPKAPATLYNANDGGFYTSDDRGKTWKFAVSAGGAQFYNVALDNSTPAWAYGSIQDHGSRRGPSRPVPGPRCRPSAGVDHCARRRRLASGDRSGEPEIVFSHGFYGNFTRTNQAEVAAAAARGRSGEGGTGGGGGRGRGRAGVTPIRPQLKEGEAELRAQWMAPIITSIHQPGVIYAGYQFVYRSTNRGDAWERISPDLTANDPSQMLLRSSSAIPYQTITALAESPRKKGLLYAGTDDGQAARHDG